MSAESGQGGGPPTLKRVAPQGAPGASHGLAAREVRAAAAVAAGIALQGLLAQEGPLHLYYLAAAAQAAGRLELDTERGRFALDFKRGAVEHASSDAPDDDLGRFLVAKGALLPEALADGERMRQSHGGDLVAALTSLGLLNPAESFRVLQEHGVAVVAKALGAAKGTFRWMPGEPLPPSSFPLGSRWGMLCDAARRLDGLAVRTLLGDRVQRPASRTGGRVDVAELKLTAHEARAAGRFDGTSSPAQLAAAHPGEADVILRMALLLGETELLSFGAMSTSTPTPTSTATATATPTPRATATATPAPPRPPVAKPAPAPTPAKPPPPLPKPFVSQDPAALEALYERVLKADHFEALGVRRDATAAQLKAAYFQLARTYHPDAGPSGEPPALKKLRADIFARLGAAWGVLADDARRAEYLQQLTSGGIADVDVSAIFKAEELFQRATVLVRTRQYDKALEALDGALKLHPDEAEFAVWKAWADFLVSSDKKRQHAASAAAMEAALKKVPRCMAAYLFLGLMAKVEGDVSLAEKQWKRGLALEPEHAEISRELKYLRK